MHKLITFFLEFGDLSYSHVLYKIRTKKLGKNYPFRKINSQCRKTESLKGSFDGNCEYKNYCFTSINNCGRETRSWTTRSLLWSLLCTFWSPFEMSCTAFPTRSGWWQLNSSTFTQYFLYLCILLGGQVAFQQTDIDSAINRKILCLMKKNLPVRFLRLMDSKA